MLLQEKLRLTKKMEFFLWDIAAGAAIVNAAGGLASITNVQTDYRVNAKFTNNIIE